MRDSTHALVIVMCTITIWVLGLRRCCVDAFDGRCVLCRLGDGGLEPVLRVVWWRQ